MLSLLSTSAEVAQEAEDGGHGRDAVLMRIDRLGDAPRALADVSRLVAHQDWRVLNILQIREAAALGGALSDAARLLRKIRRALLQLSRARDALVEALPSIRRRCRSTGARCHR
ncbi:uncharacterized protein [Aegilops tauschii subsp. strangulata]|uniref:uncharacterized protein n=1 Tax=Aegilops tauschii subsp. strangulata TaxID=200361 RepID=UPI003CC856F8